MGRVSKTNYLHLLRETIDVLSQVQTFLNKEGKVGSDDIAEAIQSLQNVARHSGVKSVKNASEAYKQKVEAEIQKKKWLAQLQQLRQQQEQPVNEEGSGEVQPENR